MGIVSICKLHVGMVVERVVEVGVLGSPRLNS